MLKSLKTGDTIILVAPSGIVNEDYVQKTQQQLQQWGLNVILGNHLFARYGRFAGTVEERLKDLQQALDNPQIQAIFCARGGYGVVQLLDSLSLDKFKKYPKWLIGYSDITALHMAISHTGHRSLHAPMSSHLATEDKNNESTILLKQALFGERPTYHIPGHPLNKRGKSKGFTRGGNLSVIQGLRKTPYDLIARNSILFIEDVGEKAYHIERMMYNLKIGGILNKITGLIIGQFSDCQEDPLMNQSIYESISNLVAEYDFPVCFDFPVGHTSKNYTLIENGVAILTVNNNDVTLTYK